MDNFESQKRCISMNDCSSVGMSCIDSYCEKPYTGRICSEGVPCMPSLECRPGRNRCLASDYVIKTPPQSIYDCLHDEYFDEGTCRKKVGKDQACNKDQMCQDGLGCSMAEKSCQTLCTVGYEEFGCTEGRICIELESSNMLGVCIESKEATKIKEKLVQYINLSSKPSERIGSIDKPRVWQKKQDDNSMLLIGGGVILISLILIGAFVWRKKKSN